MPWELAAVTLTAKDCPAVALAGADIVSFWTIGVPFRKAFRTFAVTRWILGSASV